MGVLFKKGIFIIKDLIFRNLFAHSFPNAASAINLESVSGTCMGSLMLRKSEGAEPKLIEDINAFLFEKIRNVNICR